MLRLVLCARTLSMAALVATTSWALDAGAICGRPADASMVPPPIAVRAPLNARIVLSLPSSWRTKTFCEDALSTTCRSGSFELALRIAPGDHATAGAPQIVDASLTESALGATATVVMKPRTPLAARTRYEVVRTDKAGKVPILVVGTFTTGDATDEKAPAWSGITSHRVSSTEPRKGVVSIAEECGVNAIELEGVAAEDEGTPAKAMRYAVWIVDQGKAIDYGASPLAILEGNVWPKHGGGNELVVTVPLERDGKLALPNGKKTAKLGMRAIDLAGNASAPSEITVKLP